MFECFIILISIIQYQLTSMKFNFKPLCSFIKEHKYLFATSIIFLIYLILYLIKIENIKLEHKSNDIIQHCFDMNSETYNNDKLQFLNILLLLNNNYKILTTISQNSFCYDIVLNTSIPYKYYVYDIFMLLIMFIITAINILYYINNKPNNKSQQILPTSDLEDLPELSDLSDLSNIDIKNQ